MFKARTMIHVIVDYLLRNKTALILVFLNTNLVLLKYLIERYFSKEAFAKIVAAQSVDSSITNVMIYYFSFEVASNIIDMYSALAKNFFEGDVLAKSFTKGFNNFINFRWAIWKNKIDSEIYFGIFRKASGITKYLKFLCFAVIEECFVSIWALYALLFEEFKDLINKILISVVVFMIIYCLLLRLKIYFSKLSNKGFDKLESKAKDIFINYELILTYGTLNQELNEFYADCEPFLIALRCSWMLGCLIDAIKAVFQLFARMCVFYKVFESYHDSNIKIVIQINSIASNIIENLFKFAKSLEEISSSIPLLFDRKLEGFEMENETDRIDKSGFESEISVKDVKYRYTVSHVLKNINLTIKKGEKIAITGMNGSGKSTFAKILLGLYEYEGNISVDEINHLKLSRKSLANLFTYIPQTAMLFNGTILDNIRFFNSSISEDYVIAKCIEFGVHDEFKALGYDYLISEGNSNISAAQGQKIAFMRAVIKDSPILVIDELTATMATALEKIFIDLVLDKLKDKTVIMIIHNLEMLKYFDKVAYFEKGLCCCFGKFEENYNESPEFKKYYDLKFQNKN